MNNQDSTDIAIARELIKHGVPIFIAKPGGPAKGFTPPAGWQNAVPDVSVLDKWEPGMALAAVTGHALDVVDIDSYKGGEVPARLMPRVHGSSRTPRGGTHEWVASLGIPTSHDRIPNVDIQAGVNRQGHAFVFIPPTASPEGKYEWVVEPSFDDLDGDVSGQVLVDHLNPSRYSPGVTASYDGPAYIDLTEGQQDAALKEVAAFKESWKLLLDAAAKMPEGERDAKGRGWELLVRDFVWDLAGLVETAWSPLTRDEANQIFESILPESMRALPTLRAKWEYDGLWQKAEARPKRMPPWMDFVPQIPASAGLPTDFTDDGVISWVADYASADDYLFNPGSGWKHWDGTTWSEVSNQKMLSEMLDWTRNIGGLAVLNGLDQGLMREVKQLRSVRRCQALLAGLEGRLQVLDSRMDSTGHLLNCKNGVVDLRSGRLINHERGFYFTKNTGVDYTPGARLDNPLFDQLMQSVEPDIRDWFQERLGQALSGFQPSDDAMVIMQGPGADGKTTWMDAIKSAMGDFAIQADPTILLGSDTQHSTNRADLKGVRLAYLEELNDENIINEAAVKQLTGSSQMVARKLYKDNIRWTPTHSLFVLTNHLPRVVGTDHGIWRRMLPVLFHQRIKPDPTFKPKIARGEASVAVLDWMVQGALRYFKRDAIFQPEPERVVRDKNKWRSGFDTVGGFIEDNFVFDTEAAVLSRDVTQAFNEYLQSRNMRLWSAITINQKLEAHPLMRQHDVVLVSGATKTTTRVTYPRFTNDAVPKITSIWVGLRWRTDEDDQREALNEEFEGIVGELI